MTDPQPADIAPAPVPTASVKGPSKAPSVIASIWLAISIFIGASFIGGTRFETYGGDAYTGLQNAIARGVQGIGFLIIGTGVLALVVALRKHNSD